MEDKNDEVSEIKRAMKVANARQIALSAISRQHSSGYSASTRDFVHHNDGNLTNSVIFLNLREKYSQQVEESAALKDELREAKYEIHNLTLRCRKAEDANRSNEVAGKALITALRQSLEKSESERLVRDQTLLEDCERLLRLVSGVEKHSMHGHHLVASRTATSLLLKIRQSINNIKGALLQQNPSSSTSYLANTVVLNDDHSKPSSSDLQIVDRGERVDFGVVHGTGDLRINTEALDSALLEMCRQLEDENAKQSRIVASLKFELEEAQRDASVSKLIPHYRLVIMRTRNQIKELEEQLQNEKETSNLLRKQIERMFLDPSKVCTHLSYPN
jgi:predicted RNase H-like nuclease (RuvC/YqgF family)